MRSKYHVLDKFPLRKENAQARAAHLEVVQEHPENEGSASKAESSEFPN